MFDYRKQVNVKTAVCWNSGLWYVDQNKDPILYLRLWLALERLFKSIYGSMRNTNTLN